MSQFCYICVSIRLSTRVQFLLALELGLAEKQGIQVRRKEALKKHLCVGTNTNTNSLLFRLKGFAAAAAASSRVSSGGEAGHTKK